MQQSDTIRGAQPEPGAQPKRFLRRTGRAEPRPHIRRRSREPRINFYFKSKEPLTREPLTGEPLTRRSQNGVVVRYCFALPHIWQRCLSIICLLLSLATKTAAHEGPPFPIIVDKSVGPCVVSVWTDPDVGESTFFVVINPRPGGAIPADLKIELGVQPTSGRLAEVLYPTQREDLRNQVQYKAMVVLDAQEMWRVRLVLTSAQGNGEASATVEATPPGYGRWDLLIYLVPFIAVAFLWLRAVTRRRSATKRQTADGD
jgi:hypothetical protein